METENLTRKRDNFEAAHSRTADLDVSLENTRFRKNSVRLEFGAAMLAQANNLVTNALWKNYV
jgi:flagellin-like hook-associated protein FlgL